MYRATANTTYQTAFVNYNTWEPSKADGEWSNPNIYDVATSIYAMIPAGHNGLNTGLQSTLTSALLSKATNTKVDNINANGLRCGMEEYQFMQLGGFTTPKLTLLPVAHKLTGDSKYLDAMKNVANYVLGGNQLNMTYLSGLGEESDEWIFNPNGWLTNDYNSKVYSSEPYIGYTSYFGANGGVSGYWFYNSVHSEYFSRTAAYPQAKDWPNTWPESESKFRNRYSIQGGEFTVHQQNNYMIYTMGYIKAMSNTSSSKYVHNTRPTVTLNLTQGGNFPKAGCDLTVSASGDTRRVKYYYEWHYIGESTDKANDFKFNWVPPMVTGTNVLITAVAYDDKGRITKPSAAGEKTVTISNSASCSGSGGGSCSGTGSITYERFDGITGTAISALTSAAGYPASPSVSNTRSSFEAPINIGENYGVRMHGYICPPETGTYYFWIAGDDNVQLSISSNNSPSNKSIKAYHTDWTFSQEWNKYPSTQKSGAINLTAGQLYYVEALMKEASGGDNLAVGWRKPSDGNGTSPVSVIPGSALKPYTGGGSTTSYTQDVSGLVSMEAEGYSSKTAGAGTYSGMDWTSMSDAAASGGSYMIVPDNGNKNGASNTDSPTLIFDVNFVKTGTHYLWVRQKSPNSGDNSISPRLDGSVINEWNMPDGQTNWVWSKLSVSFNVNAVGAHEFAVSMREDGTPIDKIILTTNNSYVPSGTGARELSALDSPITLNLIKAYPNPSLSVMNVDLAHLNHVDVSVFDLAGKLVYQKHHSNSVFTIQLPRGIYLLKAQSENEVFTKKISFQ